MAKRNLINIYLTFFAIFLSSNLDADNSHSMIGYWLTSQSIVLVSKCENELCATIEHIFVEEGIDQKSILDNNNKEKSLRDRTLVGINLINGFKYIDGAKSYLAEEYMTQEGEELLNQIFTSYKMGI